MKKLVLDVDQLSVDSFDTLLVRKSATGTVGGYGFDDENWDEEMADEKSGGYVNLIWTGICFRIPSGECPPPPPPPSPFNTAELMCT